MLLFLSTEKFDRRSRKKCPEFRRNTQPLSQV